MACRWCGCAGHGTTRRVVCALCKREKWPTMTGATPEGWICTLCTAEGSQVVHARQEAAQRAKRTRQSKEIPNA